MKVLMTGDNGYIGSVMKPYLRGLGHEVVGLDTNYFFWSTLGACSYDSQHYTRDLRDSLTGIFDTEFDAVIHLAGLSNDQMGDIREELTREINLIATEKLALAAKRAGVPRFIFASSCSVYGSGNGSDFSDESDKVNPLTTYAKCKADAEELLSSMASLSFAPVFLRNATVYGNSPRLRTDLIVNTMTVRAFIERKIQVFGDGSLWRPLVHVNDVSEAFHQALIAPSIEVNNEVINVGFTDDNHTVRQVAEMVQKYLPETQIEYVEQEVKDTRNYRVRFDKILEIFPNFIGGWDVSSGIAELIGSLQDYEALLERNITLDEMFGSKFVRLKKLKDLQTRGILDDNLRWVK